MSGIMKLFFLLAAIVCISQALPVNESRQQCLCQRVRKLIGAKADIKDIQIYKPTIFCDKVEILVTNKNGLRYCLNPSLKTAKLILTNIMSKQKTTATTPTEFSSTTGSSTASL